MKFKVVKMQLPKEHRLFFKKPGDDGDNAEGAGRPDDARRCGGGITRAVASRVRAYRLVGGNTRNGEVSH